MAKLLSAVILICSFFFLVIPVMAKQMEKESDEATPSTEAANFNSYEQFWPVTAGRVMGEPLYFLKTLKENLREVLYFSDLKKGDYNLTLSEKRLVEAEKLYLDKKDFINGQNSLEEAQARREKSVVLVKKAKDAGRLVGYAESRLVSSFKRQIILLTKIEMTVSEEAQTQVKDNKSRLENLLEQLPQS